MLSDVQAVLGACRVGKSRQLAQDLNYRRAGELQPLLLHPLGPDKDPPSRGTPPHVQTFVSMQASVALLLVHQGWPPGVRRPEQWRHSIRPHRADICCADSSSKGSTAFQQHSCGWHI